MAECIVCGKRVGFFSRRDFKSGKGPFCKECVKPMDAFVFFYMQQEGLERKSDSDPKAAIWMALCHLICAERVNADCFRSYATGGTSHETNSWMASKNRALGLVENVLATLPDGSPGNILTKAIIERATNIQEPKTNEVKIETISGASPITGGTTYTPDIWAILSGEVTINDLIDFKNTFPEHEWLGNSAYDKA